MDPRTADLVGIFEEESMDPRKACMENCIEKVDKESSFTDGIALLLSSGERSEETDDETVEHSSASTFGAGDCTSFPCHPPPRPPRPPPPCPPCPPSPSCWTFISVHLCCSGLHQLSTLPPRNPFSVLQKQQRPISPRRPYIKKFPSINHCKLHHFAKLQSGSISKATQAKLMGCI